MTAYDPYLRARTIQCRVDGVDALTPILRERGVVDDDLDRNARHSAASYLVDKGLATLDSSACRAKAPCYDDDTIEGRIEGATNDYYPGQTQYSYSYDSDWHGVGGCYF